ncbi:MAG: DUF3037 domain-containing protein [Gemmatimonas sp.]|nr:DUF3037 domain-containing protein [Gemmatimonas sp.]
MNAERRVAYHFAVLRVVPHVHLGEFVNVGVILHARTIDFLGMEVVTDAPTLTRMVSDVDVDLLSRYLKRHEAICRGELGARPIALLPPSERFHWLCAPRSDLLQCSAIHEGLEVDPRRTLQELFAGLVRRPAMPPAPETDLA